MLNALNYSGGGDCCYIPDHAKANCGCPGNDQQTCLSRGCAFSEEKSQLINDYN
jgi:hypothetical protein